MTSKLSIPGGDRTPPRCAATVCGRARKRLSGNTTQAAHSEALHRATGMVIRRRLLPRTEQHVYFVADIENDLITVLRVWGARRGRGPRL
jgi:hypothetical protein